MRDALKFGSDAYNATLPVTPASENHAIPDDSSGERAKVVYLVADVDIFFLPATDESGTPTTLDGATTVTTATGARLRERQVIVVDVSGYSHIMTIGSAGSEEFNMAPVEWG